MNQIIYAGKHLLTYSVTSHAHSSWELIYCTSGAGSFVFQDRVLAYETGDVVIIPPLTPHHNESVTGFTNVHLNMLDPQLNLKEPTLLHDDANHFLLDAFNGAFYFFASDPGSQGILISTYAALIINLILSHLDAPMRSPIVEEIEGVILRNYPDENFKLEAYLHSLPFNYDYLRKLFKMEIGVTPHKLLVDTRLQAAAERLSRPDENGSISEVAHLCGFHEPLYFSRTFKKEFGMSPSEYQLAMSQRAELPQDAESIKIQL